MRRFALIFALLSACDGPGSAPLSSEQDEDGDGWPGATDCDDANPLVNPSAREVCDPAGADEDCDLGANDLDPEGATDPSDWYPDADGDGFAPQGASPVQACEAPSGHASALGDCDDADRAVHPDADEICDPGDIDEDCNGAADDSDPAILSGSRSTWFSDADGDGWGDPDVTLAACDAPAGHVAEGGDCDDGDRAISPGASEVCDDANVDEDCDGAADDEDTAGDTPLGRDTWYRDEDGDGYGADRTVEQCDLSVGLTLDDGDCDDSDAAISPSAMEECDPSATDEDCDGLIDDDDPGVIGVVEWFADGDGDGFGGTESTAACLAPPDHHAEASDCDDADAAVFPGAQERCDAADADEDCDGLGDDLDPSAIGQTTWYRDLDGDGWGTTTPTASRCDEPAGYAAEPDDCDDTSDDVSPDEAEVCADGVDQDCDGVDPDCRYAGEGDIETDYDTKIYGYTSASEFGTGVVGGDFDGDGVGDLLVSGPSGTHLSRAYGHVSVFSGPFVAGSRSSVADDSRFIYNTDAEHAGYYGDLLENVGDLDGDGADEFVIGGADDAAWLFVGGETGTSSSATYEADVTCSSAAATGNFVAAGTSWACGYDNDGLASRAGWVSVFEGFDTMTASYFGEDAEDQAGSSVAAGDVNGDGFADLWIGAPGDDVGGSGAGAAYLVHGPARGALVDLSAADAKVAGVGSGSIFGTRVAMPGDVDADGYDDLLASAPYQSVTYVWEGRVYLFTTVPSGSSSSSAATATIVGENTASFLGMHDFAGGDVNGDDDLDLLFGTPYDADGGTDAGGVWLLYGPHAGTLPLTTADAAWRGDDASDGLGTDVALLPDTDGDGDSEIAMGAPRGDNGASLDRGAIWVIDGR